LTSSSRRIHLAIQFGPYLLDWLETSELRIRNIISAKESIMLLLHPNSDPYLYNGLSIHYNRDELIKFIFNFRKIPYDSNTHNCESFVYGMLLTLGETPKWTRRGLKPIRSFIQIMNGHDRDNYKLSLFNITKKINNHDDLKDFWTQIQPFVLRLLKADPAMALELLDLIIGLERGFITSRKDQSKTFDKLDVSAFYDKEGKPVNNYSIYAIRNKIVPKIKYYV